MAVVTCARCGRNNPDDLRFCQDCGNRLEPPARRVEPTPPRGVVLSSEPDGLAQRSRPAAPDFVFAPKPAASSGVQCPSCATVNPPASRFCAECGHALDEGPSRPAGGNAGGLAAAPVLGVAPDPAPPAAASICARCRGTNDAAMVYCQYCGARLDSDGEFRQKLETHPESPAAQRDSGRFQQAAAAAGPAAAGPLPSPERPPVPDPYATGRYAPPAPTRVLGKLVVIAQDGSPGREYELVADQTDIGREEGAVRLPNDPYVSPRHGRITHRNGRFFIRDLDSVNGVFVRLRAPAPLAHGDLVLVGLEVLRFEAVSDAEKGFGPAVEQGTQVFGSPAAPRRARLCQRTVEGVTRDVYYVVRDELVIGRESGDVVFTGDPFMSRRHASVNRDPATGSFSIKDLGSSNGTYVAIRGEHPLQDGDHVRVGQHLFRIATDAGGQA